MVIDTPGFDDTNRPAIEVLEEISDFLAAPHAAGIPLKGILYLHKITDNRITATSKMYLSILESLVGEAAIPNLILVTTMWGHLNDKYRGVGMRREQELMDQYWQPFAEKGSYVAQFDGSQESAYSFIWQLLAMDSVVLQIQKEIIQEKKSVAETTAGVKLRETFGNEISAFTTKVGNARTRAPTDKSRRGVRSGDWKFRRDKPPGTRIQDRIKAEMRARPDGKRIAASILVAILNISLFVVQFVG